MTKITTPVSSSESLTIHPIGHIHTDFPEKFGIPRQSGLVPSLNSFITFEKPYQNPDCFRDILHFSHLWLLWGFSENIHSGWSPTVRPPRLGGNIHTGVFASRSPFRPNPIGLSSVRLEKLSLNTPEGPVLYISGADLMDGTPIYDIKPYIPFSDSHPDAAGSFTKAGRKHILTVHCEESLLSSIVPSKRQALLEVLSLDPRPAYQNNPERIYHMDFADCCISFRVKDMDLYVEEIQKR